MSEVKIGVSGQIKFTQELKDEYADMFERATVRAGWVDPIERTIIRIIPNRPLYERVSKGAGGTIPWYFIAATHMRERDLSLKHHLHNGNPLTARTFLVPAGRPLKGNPPFTWEESAIDALQYQKLDQWTDWSLGGLLFQLEAYNGFGYRRKGMATPYLWSGTDQYTSGKYVEIKDPARPGKWKSEFRPALVDKQIGTAALIKQLAVRKFVDPKR